MKFTLLAASTFALANQDYVNLKTALKQYILQNGEENIPILVRMSFHDLAGGLGPHGCLDVQSILNEDGNQGISDKIKELAAFVNERFPQTPFPAGDVISLAGKTAVELAFPCMKINWRYGRAVCSATANKNAIPSGKISTLAEMKPFLDIYGLDHKEMAVLVAGGHGIAKAAADVSNSGFGSGDRHLADINSGKDWIEKTFGSWTGEIAHNGSPQWTMGSLLRITSDLIYFPSTIRASGGTPDDNGKPIEDYMRSFVSQDRSVFDAEFAKVYTKMLEIGTSSDSLTTFVDNDQPGYCTNSGPPPNVPLPPAVTTTYSSATPSTTNAATKTQDAPKSTNAPEQKTTYATPSPTTKAPIYSSANRASGLVAVLLGALLL